MPPFIYLRRIDLLHQTKGMGASGVNFPFLFYYEIGKVRISVGLEIKNYGPRRIKTSWQKLILIDML
jgi:hypothetical protein